MPDGKAPHFPQQPVARQNEDGSLELECFLESAPPPEVRWYFQERDIPLGSGSRFSSRLESKGGDHYSAILQIRDLTDNDAGPYKCALNNQHGKGNANFNLKLTGFSAPTFVEKPKITSRDDGALMVMEYTAKSLTRPNVVWQRNDDPVPESDRIRISFNDEGRGIYHCQLEIRDPTKEKDAGQFTSIMKNESGKLTATFTVKFEVPPGAPIFAGKPQINQKTTDAGDPFIIMEVPFQAEGTPIVNWINPRKRRMKESSRIRFILTPEGGKTYLATMELRNYKTKDSGTYVCNIVNNAGEANCELTVNIEGPEEE